MIDDVLDESTVERFVMDAIAKYFDKHLLNDGFFWREAIRLLTKKYGIQEKFNEALKISREKVKQ